MWAYLWDFILMMFTDMGRLSTLLTAPFHSMSLCPRVYEDYVRLSVEKKIHISLIDAIYCECETIQYDVICDVT